ncbi:MAG: hypothetical protein CM1200mP18_16960 [Gammaproteobacteria bacterium]|nr:MAG: hypothetical protein CM1200mP18_16960 [Gammaproteobacteria bacterium]
MTLSDAGAHLSFLCDAGFGLHLFGHWVRERGDLSLEKAVEAVTVGQLIFVELRTEARVVQVIRLI